MNYTETFYEEATVTENSTASVGIEYTLEDSFPQYFEKTGAISTPRLVVDNASRLDAVGVKK